LNKKIRRFRLYKAR